YVEAHITAISPKVVGHVVKVHVNDNQLVKKGDLLVEIDPRDYETQLEREQANVQTAMSKQKSAHISVGLTEATGSAGIQQASSTVEAAKSNVQTTQEQVAGARNRHAQSQVQVLTAQANAEQMRAQLEAAEAESVRDDADEKRYRDLFEKDEVTRQQLD